MIYGLAPSMGLSFIFILIRFLNKAIPIFWILMKLSLKEYNTSQAVLGAPAHQLQNHRIQLKKKTNKKGMHRFLTFI